MGETILFLEKLFGYYLAFSFGYGFYGAIEDRWARENMSKLTRLLFFLLSPYLLPISMFIWIRILIVKIGGRNDN